MIIKWCNNNSGFLTAILSIIGLLLSLIAIIISIQTARLPYRKKLKLSSTTNILFYKNYGGKTSSEFQGISINAANIGNRYINIIFLGLAIKNKGAFNKIELLNRELGGKGTLAPTELTVVEYSKQDLLEFSKEFPSTKVYLFALDTKGKIHKKYYGRINKIIENIKECREERRICLAYIQKLLMKIQSLNCLKII